MKVNGHYFFTLETLNRQLFKLFSNSLAPQDNTLSEPYSDGNESDIQDDIIVIAGGK